MTETHQKDPYGTTDRKNEDGFFICWFVIFTFFWNHNSNNRMIDFPHLNFDEILVLK